MVDGRVTGFEVQQTLHGYGEGHRLLAGSASLPPRDMRTMLILSDSSGGGAKLPEDGYLTGYPLSESAKYVLARTWPAPEMKRPGCVWTHSVVIDFADLASLSSASTILRLFKRPATMTREIYEAPLTVGYPEQPEPGKFDPDVAAGLLGALYGSSNSKIVGALDAGLDEDIVLRVWMQQWPRLRRSFRFCTFTASDRSTQSEAFDLQLVPSASSIPRLRVAKLVSPGETAPAPEFGPLLDDLRDPDVDGLRGFLRESGVEVPEGRGAMRPLCAVFAFVHGRAMDATTALAALDGLDRSRASTARRQLAGRLAQQIESVGDWGFRMVVDEIRSDGEFDEALAARVAAELWRREPVLFVEALTGPDPLSSATGAALARIEVSELVQGISREPAMAPQIAERRADLLVAKRLWTIAGIDIERTIASCQDRPERLVTSLMSSSASVSPSVAGLFPGRTIIDALERGGSLSNRDRVEPWLQALHKPELIDALRNRELKYAPSVVRAAHAVDPDDVSCDGGGDPWFDAAAGMVGELTAEEDVYFRAFLLARGLGRQSSQSTALIRLSFEKAHRALADGRMSTEGWRMLHKQLPFAMPWQEWDRCWRVRNTVGAKFVGMNLNTSDFVNVADDPDLWWQVASEASRAWGGWKYLKQVQRRLETDSTGDPGGRKLAGLRRLL
jgi:hypothetical protein